MDLERALSDMRARCDELKADAPGRVVVAKIHRIGAVQALRACQQTLTADEISAIARARSELKSRLVGLELASPPPKPKVLHRFMRMKEAREYEIWQQMSTAAGGPAQLPPPTALLDAAEAWLIAQIATDRVGSDRASDADVHGMTEPWRTAQVVQSNLEGER